MEPAARRRRVVAAGHTGDEATAREGRGDDDAVVRAAALGALSRLGVLGEVEWEEAMADPSPVVRRRAAELAADAEFSTAHLGAVRQALQDHDPLVVEAACWALGEHGDDVAVPALAALAGTHGDTRCREAAVAALGAIGDDRGLEALVAATHDKPTVRRRAAAALAAFSGPEVDATLEACLDDHDWQVRQIAEILLERPPR